MPSRLVGSAASTTALNTRSITTAPSAGSTWVPVPTQAWEAAMSRVFRRTTAGIGVAVEGCVIRRHPPQPQPRRLCHAAVVVLGWCWAAVPWYVVQRR